MENVEKLQVVLRGIRRNNFVKKQKNANCWKFQSWFLIQCQW